MQKTKNMKENRKGLRHLLTATRYSFSGMCFACKGTAVRHELLLGICNFLSLWLFHVKFIESIALSSIWILLLAVEILNTAIEEVVDLVSPTFNEHAKRAKDLGSAAVFLLLVLFFSCWGFVLFRRAFA